VVLEVKGFESGVHGGLISFRASLVANAAELGRRCGEPGFRHTRLSNHDSYKEDRRCIAIKLNVDAIRTF
jgi:hypothetical protein